MGARPRNDPRSNDTHAATSDPESKLYRKSKAAPALPSYQGHVLSDNRHGLVLNVQPALRTVRPSGTSPRECWATSRPVSA